MIKKNTIRVGIYIFVFLALPLFLSAQRKFQHPGILHKKSDLERIKYGIEADIEPWASSFENLKADDYSSYNYEVKGDKSMTLVDRGGTNGSAYENDMVAAYQNALMYWLTDDQRHADKSIEILNAWSNLTSVIGIPLDVGLYGAPMINAAELIKHSNAGWAEEDMQKFSDMLVYPGYSSTTIPDIANDNHTFYWGIYNGDPGRHGNQGLAGWKTMIALGIFLDNDTIYDRAIRYVSGQSHRSDDLPYESGPKVSTSVISSNPYHIIYNYEQQYTMPDYGYDDVITNYIYDNGQSEESARDQTHAMYGVSLCAQIAEVAWNQGDDLYSLAENRILTGLEYHCKYNVSYLQAYDDQPEPWEPDPEAGEFYQYYSRTARWQSLKINPYKETDTTRILRGVNIARPYWEMPLNHYKYRMNFDDSELLWLQRARDYNIAKTEKYEVRSASKTDSPGWGALAYGRPEGCSGDPISGFDTDGLPVYAMNVLPMTIEAENFDYFTSSGEELTYKDATAGNSGGQYRSDENVDIETCSEGGYQLSSLEDGEWLTYTVFVPATSTYDIKIRYSADKADGKIKFAFSGNDKTGEVAIPFGVDNSTGKNDWSDFSVASGLALEEGVQSMRISITGTSNAFNINSISISHNPIGNPKINLKVDSVNQHAYLNWENLNFVADTQFVYRHTENLFTASASIAPVLDFQTFTDSTIEVGTNYFYWVTAKHNNSEYISNAVSTHTEGTDSSFIISPIKTSVLIDSSLQLSLSVGTAFTKQPNVVWSSSDESIVTVNQIGIITGINWGDAEIFARNIDGEHLASCSVSVQGDPNVVKIEAEEFSDSYGIQTESTTDAGGGTNVGWIDTDDWMEYEIFIPKEGIYALDYRLASSSSGGEIDMSIGELPINNMMFSSTGGWQNWTTNSTLVYMPTGKQTIRIAAIKGGWNINWFKLSFKYPAIAPSGVSILSDSLLLITNDKEQLFANITPVDSTDQRIVWKSSNPNIATVSVMGLVQAINPGNAIIVASSMDNSQADSCIVKIEASSLYVNDLHSELTLTIYPNPVKKDLTIEFTPSAYQYYEVYNLYGVKLQSSTIENKTCDVKISLEGFLTGTYLIVLKGKQSLKTLKVSKI